MTSTLFIAVALVLAGVLGGHFLGDRRSTSSRGLVVAVVIAVALFLIVGFDHIAVMFDVVRIAFHLHK